MSTPRHVISQPIITRLPVDDHRRLKVFCESHGVTHQQVTQDALSAYLRYLENGQWAVTVSAELIQPAIEASRTAGLSLSAWLEACVRHALQIPPAPVYRRGAKTKEHPENVTIFCRCGCGTPLKKYDFRWRERKYLNGHQPKRGKWLVWNRSKWKSHSVPPIDSEGHQ